MKSPTRPRLSRTVLSTQVSALVVAGLSLWGGLPVASAADRYWDNGSTDFNAAADWLGGVPGSADRAIFSTVLLNPSVNAPTSILGATFYSPGAALSASSGPLTLLSSITNSDLAAALYTASPGLTTISAPLVLGAPLATGSAGFSELMGSELLVSGDISGSRGIQKLGFGTLTLSGNNTFTGGVSGNGGNGNFGLTRLNINSDTALGTGAFTINQGNGGSTVGNTSGSARTLANAVTLSTGSGFSSIWDLPVNGSGDLTFTGLSTLTGAAASSCTITVIGGTLTLKGGLAESAAGLGFTKTGSGTLVLGGTVAHTGAFSLAGGAVMLDMNAGGSITNTALTLSLANTNFVLKGAASGSSAQTLAAPSFVNRTGIAVDGNGGAGTTLTISNTWSRSGGSTLAVQLTGNAALASAPVVSSGGLVIGTGNAAFATVTDSGGTGFATTSGANVVRYTAATTMTATDSGSTINYVTKVTDAGYAAGTLTLTGGNRTFNSLQIDTSAGAGTLDLAGTTLSLSDRGLLFTGTNNFTIQAGVLGGVAELVLHQFSSGTVTISAPIGGVASNVANLTKDGPGTLLLSGANLYANGTVVNEGTLAVTGSLKGTLIATGATVATSGTVSLQAAGAVNSSTLTVSGSGKLVQTVANAISGSAAVTVNGFLGTANATLSLANNYSGITTLTSGNLNLGDPAAIGTGTLSISGGRLDNTSGTAMTLANNNAITFGGGTVFAGTNSLNLGTGAINLGTLVRNIVVSANTLTFGGVASGAGGGLTKNGPGTLALNAANTYTGITTAGGGVLLLNDAGALPGGQGTAGGLSNLTIAGGVVGLGAGNFTRQIGTTATDLQFTSAGGGFAAYGAPRSVNLGGAGATLTWASTSFLPNPNQASAVLVLGAASATHTVDFQNPIILGSATATRTVQVDDGAATVDGKLSGSLTSAGGTVGFAKIGAGTLELSASNTYNGLTSVVAGKLLLTGDLTGTAGVNVAGGATLGGSGAITTAGNGSVILFSGASLAPGNTVGTLTATLTLGQFDISGAAGGTGAFKFELGTTSDQVKIVTGALNIGAGVLNFDDFVFGDAGGFGTGTYTLFDTSAGIVGSLGGNLSGTVGGLTGTLSLSADTQDLLLTVVPEPGCAALLLGGLGTLLGFRRRRV